MSCYINQFDSFDPLKDRVSGLPTFQAPEIASRARQLLRGRTAREIEGLAYNADSLIEEYFESIKNDEIERLEAEGDARFCEQISEGGRVVECHLIPEMMDELEILTRDDISDVEALKEALGMFAILSDSEVPNIQDFEYFAAMGLWNIADAMERRQFRYDLSAHKKIKRKPNELDNSDISIISDYLLQAMDAVCYSEHLLEIKKMNDRYLKRVMNFRQKLSAHEEDTEAIRKEILEEFKAEEALRKSEKGRNLSRLRHKGRDKARAAVLSNWENNPAAFPSAEKASCHYSEWLPTQGHKQFTPRTIASWIRQYAKKKGILLR
jgi:hypothetical protein